VIRRGHTHSHALLEEERAGETRVIHTHFVVHALKVVLLQMSAGLLSRGTHTHTHTHTHAHTLEP